MFVTDIPTLVADIKEASEYLKSIKDKSRARRANMSSEDGKRFFRVRKLVTWLLVIRAASRNTPRLHLKRALSIAEWAPITNLWETEYKMEI